MIKKRIETKDAVISYNITLDDVLKGTSKRELQNKLNAVIQQSILPTIEKGLSPVAGERVLKRYSEGYKNAIKSGRYAQYDKKPTPATLKLSGEMLSHYKAKALDEPNTATIGIHEDDVKDKKIMDLVKYHQKGTDKMPARPFIPKDGVQRFTAKIEQGIRAAFSYVLSRALADSLNKGRNQK